MVVPHYGKEAEIEAWKGDVRSKRDDCRTRVQKMFDSFRTLHDEASKSSGLSFSSSTTGHSGINMSSSQSFVGSLMKVDCCKLQPQQLRQRKNTDGTETVATTKAILHPDGTRVIEKQEYSIVYSVLVIPPAEPSGCGGCVNDLCCIRDPEEEDLTDDFEDHGRPSVVVQQAVQRPSRSSACNHQYLRQISRASLVESSEHSL